MNEVAAYANDPSNAPEWYANISAVDWRTPPPPQVGTQVAFVARFLGRTMRYTYEITEHTPTSLVMRTSEGPFPMETLLAPAMRRANRKDLAALKRILEA